jgi:hypothetical protein
MKTRPILISLLFLALFLSACVDSADITPTGIQSFDGVYTAAAATITAQAGLATPTNSPLPTTTPSLWASPTLLPSTSTMQSASYSYSSANGCYNATYVTDVTIPDGTVLAPGETFTKTWKLQNSGSCSGRQISYYPSKPARIWMERIQLLMSAVTAGETESLSITLVAPETEGTYTGYWRLSADSGDAFGELVFVIIVVSEDAATATPINTSTPEEVSATDTPTSTPTATDTPTDTPVPASAEPTDSTIPETSTPEAGTI